MTTKRLLLCLFLSMGLFTAAWAADDTQGTTPAPAAATSGTSEEPQDQLLRAAGSDAGSGWIFGGGVAVTNPGYVGYNRQITPFPLVFYHYGRFFFAGFSAGYLLSNGEHYRFSLVVVPVISRLKASDSSQLAGIQTREWSLDGGANLDLFGGWGRYSIGVFHDLLDRNNGTGVNTGYHYSFHLGDWVPSRRAGRALGELQPDQLLLRRESGGSHPGAARVFTRQRRKSLRGSGPLHRHQ